MTIKKRTTTMTIGTDGATTTASKDVGLGAAYAKILKFEFKGDDANVEATATVTVTDADDRTIFYATGLDFGTDDSAATTAQQTEQSYSTVGLGIYPVPVETEVVDRLGDPSANTEGPSPAIIARSPITILLESMTDGDVVRVHTFVEV